MASTIEIESSEAAAQPQEGRLPAVRGRTRWGGMLGWVAIGAVAFHAAYSLGNGGWLMLFYLFALLQLARAETWRQAFYPGLAAGLLIGAIRLGFFWRIFGGGAAALWFVYAFWIGLFVALARLCLRRFGPGRGWFFIPFVWVGLEYFRSELYYLRFSWLTPGFAFAAAPWLVPLKQVGVYGIGFLLVSVAAAAGYCWSKSKVRSVAVLAVGAVVICAWGMVGAGGQAVKPVSTVRVSGVQMEFPTEAEVLVRLNDLIRAYPDTEVVVLSEYTISEQVPQKVKSWCQTNKRYLVVGGKEPAPDTNYYNTAFVVGPTGDILFRQVKCVPIQFFKDGLPAPEQRLWDSPWGKIGICICYDLSYSRVTDRLVELGAQALLVPTMDVEDWGESQHQLHARVAPVRAAEYGIPVFRLASSGISQWVDSAGRVKAAAPCPGNGAMLSGTLGLAEAGRLPLDRWVGPFGAGLTGALMLWFCVQGGWKSEIRNRKPETNSK